VKDAKEEEKQLKRGLMPFAVDDQSMKFANGNVGQQYRHPSFAKIFNEWTFPWTRHSV